MKISSKLSELKPTDLNCNVFDVYSYDGLSMQDLLCQFFTKINECIKVSNETIDLATWLVNEGLKKEVVEKLVLWLNDGTLENLINVNLFNTLHTKIENINSQLTQKPNEEDLPFINVKKYGLKGDGLTNDTDALISLIDTLKVKHSTTMKGGTLFFPKGKYIIDSFPLRDKINIFGEGSGKTIFLASDNSYSEYLFYIDDAPVNGVTYKDFDVVGNDNNINQSCFHIEAIEQNIPSYTGGLWFSVFENINISNFSKYGIYCVAVDGKGDLANQFLNFKNVRVYRKGDISDSVSLFVDGQAGQFKFDSCCFSAKGSLKKSEGVNIVLRNTMCEFDLLTCESSERGIDIKGANVLFSHPWFENISQVIYTESTTNLPIVRIDGGNFANAGYSDEGDGYCFYICNAGSLYMATSPRFVGLLNNIITGSEHHKVIDVPEHLWVQVGTEYKTVTCKIAKQMACEGELIITTNTINRSNFIINPGGYIENIIGQIFPGKSITLYTLGEVTIKTGGNIGVSSDIVIEKNKTVTLKYLDIVNKFVIVSIY